MPAQPAARPPAARERLHPGLAQLAHVALDHEQAAEHDQEADQRDQRVVGEREDQQHEPGEHPERRPPDHPRRVPVERRAGDLLDETGIGRVELRLDLLQDLLLFVGERHHRPRQGAARVQDTGRCSGCGVGIGVGALGTPHSRAHPRGQQRETRSVLLGRRAQLTEVDGHRRARRRLPIGTPDPRAGARRAPPPRPGSRSRPGRAGRAPARRARRGTPWPPAP